MIEFIQRNNIPCDEVLVRDFARGASKFNEVHLPSVDLTKPVIIAEILPGRYNVIDGNHRMEKARRLWLKMVPAYKIAPEQHIQFLTTEKGYLA